MSTKSTVLAIPDELIKEKIYLLRGKKVIFDRDLAVLYGVVTKVLNQSVKRNIERFPEDFMFQINDREMEIWKSHIVTSTGDIKGLRKLPYVFTEQGVAMLSTVLKSKQAIQVNIHIIRVFTKIRELLADNQVLREKIESMETKYDLKFKTVLEVIGKLLHEDRKPIEKIGFHTNK